MSEHLSPEEALRMAGAMQDVRAPVLTPIHGGRADKKKARFVRTSTTALMAKQFDPIRWIVEDYLPEGFSVLAGRQKLGKTWLAIDISLAVACGGVAMGSIDCEQGDVLYIDMENGERRIQRRIDALYPDDRNRPDLSRLEWVSIRMFCALRLTYAWPSVALSMPLVFGITRWRTKPPVDGDRKKLA